MTGSIALAPHETPSRRKLRLAGRVTIAQIDELYEAAREIAAHKCDVSICCHELDYLDTAAIQVIIGLGRHLEMQNCSCELNGIRGQVRHDFHRIGLAHLLEGDPGA
jgi:anti-anti-sigma regulatory factor